MGIHVPAKESKGIMFIPPQLKFAYCPDTPVLLEGSIMKNMLLGVDQNQVKNVFFTEEYVARGNMLLGVEQNQVKNTCLSPDR